MAPLPPMKTVTQAALRLAAPSETLTGPLSVGAGVGAAAAAEVGGSDCAEVGDTAGHSGGAEVGHSLSRRNYDGAEVGHSLSARELARLPPLTSATLDALKLATLSATLTALTLATICRRWSRCCRRC